MDREVEIVDMMMKEVIPYINDKRYLPLRICPECKMPLKLLGSEVLTNNELRPFNTDWIRRLNCDLCNVRYTDRKCFTEQSLKGFLERQSFADLDEVEKWARGAPPELIMHG